MGKGFTAIVLSQGIAAGAPFTLNRIPKIGLVSPPTLVDSITTETVAGDWTIGTDPAPAATETLRFLGGFVSDTGVGHDNLVGGRGAVAALFANARNVVLGTLARADASGGGAAANVSLNVVIGYNASLNQGVGSCQIIGSNFVQGASFPFGNLTCIGESISSDVAFTGPAIGNSFVGRGRGCGMGISGGAAGNFNNWVTFGFGAIANANNATVLGDGARVNHATSIALGRNTVSVAANQLIAGGQNLAITSVLIGGGDTFAGGVAVTWRFTNGSGVDDPAASVTYDAPQATGAAVGAGRFIWRTGAPHGSDAVLQTLGARLEIWQPGTNGAAVNFLGTSGAAAAAGTLLNAPTAGDPADWIPVLFNGNVRYLPAWA